MERGSNVKHVSSFFNMHKRQFYLIIEIPHVTLQKLKMKAGRLYEKNSLVFGVYNYLYGREITSEKDIILVHTVRVASAEGLPVTVKVELFMVIKHSYVNKVSSNYVITNQILLSEQYIPVNQPQATDSGNGSEQPK